MAATSMTDIDEVKPSVHIKEEDRCNRDYNKFDVKNPLFTSPKDARLISNSRQGRTLPRLSASQAINNMNEMKSEINIAQSRNEYDKFDQVKSSSNTNFRLHG